MEKKRKDQVEQGVYDGRYKTKVIVDKKKEDRKRKAREKVKREDNV